MSEVTFYGGPRDGQVMTFAHGDTVEFPIHERTVATAHLEASNEPVEFKTALYRRSLRNTSVFVFQP